jgi:DNA transformation protein and related proteins
MDNDTLEEMFQALGPITIKRMFGGKGIYCDGMIIAIFVRDSLMLKGDQEAGPAYEAAGARQWSFPHNKTGKEVKMPYWTLPENAWDDPDEMADWARMAFEVARRAQ